MTIEAIPSTVAADPSAPETTRRPRAREWLAWAALIVVATAAQLVRQTGIHSWNTVWAEDGVIFYTGTRSLGQLFDPYGGYFQLVPRVLGLTAHALPLADLARYYAAAGALVTTLCAVAVWRFAGQLVTSRWLRAVLALSVVLLPTLVLEQLANGVNTIWALTFAGWWAILYRPRSLLDAALPALFVFLAVTSNALALSFVPAIAVVVWLRRDKPAFVVGGAFLAGTLVQLAVMVRAPGLETQGSSYLTDLPQIFAVRVLGAGVVGQYWVGDLWDSFGNWFAVAVTVAVVALVAVLAWCTAPKVRWVGLANVGFGVALYAVSVYGRGTITSRIPASGYNYSGTRWASLAIWFLMSGIFILASGLRSGVAKQVVVAVLVAQFVLVATFGFRSENARSLGPVWTATLHDARAACQLPRNAHRTVLVTAVPRTPNWAVPLQC